MPVDHVDVQVAVVVEIKKSGGPAEIVPRRLEVAGAARHLAKEIASLVAVERVGLVRKVCGVQVQPPVPVVVAEIDAHARLLFSVFVDGDAGREPNLGEFPVPFIAVQVIREGVVRDVQIGIAIVVVVPPDRAQPIVLLLVGHAGGATHIRERAIPVVVE